MKKLILLFAIISLSFAYSQENLDYQKPPKEILELVDAEMAPSVFLDDDREYMILLYRNQYKSIAELSEEELRLGGLRIDPKKNISSRARYFNNIKIKNIKNGTEVMQVKNLPEASRLTNFKLSPDQKKMAMTHTGENGVSLWLIDIEKAEAKKLTDEIINSNIGDEINWFSDNAHMLIKTVPSDKKELINTEIAVPEGPTVSVSDGKLAQNRTYQDLLKNKNDEFNFEQLAKSEIHKIDLSGKKEMWLASAMYAGISFSPDGEYVMISTIEKPFSYLVPFNRFPSKTEVYTKDAQKVSTLIEVPLIEDLPKGFMAVREGKRDFSWRDDKPASLTYTVALDGGDPANEVEYRDEVFQLDAPFKGDGKSIFKSINRFSSIRWANDEIAIAYDYWWNTRNTKTYLFNPSDPSEKPEILFDRDYQDRYNDPGSFVMIKNEYNRNVIALDGEDAFLIGSGFTPEGQFPFVDEFDLKDKDTERLYQSEYTDKIEDLRDFNPENKQLLVRIESPSEYPNYYFRELKNDKLTQLTFFDNPFKSIQNVTKKLIKYKREDGLDLSGTLYLPVGYDTLKKEKMPMIIWAYPTEYKDKSTAGQTTQNPNSFTYPYYGSMVYWVTRGYVVLDDAAFPIVGEGDEEPNDTFIPQLVANGKAAIDAVDAMGYIDRNKVAVAGHSYGAFMTANLLTHSDLFAAGIARSGAYNRTLTPFGFQSEERSYWEAPDIYNTMSPFMNSDKMKHPLLLIHGEADNNSGTYPMQSERYFNALKGLGATARLVILPKESHSYVAKESILHLLWEQDQWLEKYVKNKK
jgi:dipeptidyl aminopeptidase/acylaminoacyl peptidase